MNNRRRAVIAVCVQYGGEVGGDRPSDSGAPRRRSPGRTRARVPARTRRRSAARTDRWRTPRAARTAAAGTRRSLRVGGDRHAQVAGVRRPPRPPRGDRRSRRSTPAKRLERHLDVGRATPACVCLSSDSDGTRTRVRSAASFSRDEQRGQGLAGAARHDQLSTIRRVEALHHIVDRFALMPLGLFRRRGGPQIGGEAGQSTSAVRRSPTEEGRPASPGRRSSAWR